MLGLAKLLDDASAPQHSCLILMHYNIRVYTWHYLHSMQWAAAAQCRGLTSLWTLLMVMTVSLPSALHPQPPAIPTVEQSSYPTTAY